MNNFPSQLAPFELDHVGVAVTNLDEASRSYEAMGWQAGQTEEVPREKVRVRMFNLANQSRIELIEATSEDSTIAKFLQKRGPGIHHIALRVKDVRATLAQLKLAGIKLIHEEPFQGAHGCRVAFIHPSSMGGVLIELSQPPEGSKR
jgi:methylmalonyl-CoA/ethylmalonyl-CoA epimerase